ncbi:MAG: SGNH/GDSL hydrolase family protein [Christensenellales bacterium]|jgi:hypothetical protein
MKKQNAQQAYSHESSEASNSDIVFYDIKEEPFTIHGLYDPKGQDAYKRLPDSIAQSTSDGVERLYKNTAGGRLRFATDSDSVYIRVKMPSLSLRPHMTILSCVGFDLYLNKNGKDIFAGCFIPPADVTGEYGAMVSFKDDFSMKEITINFPLYGDIESVMIGIRKNAQLKKHGEYKISKPILFYGSSITQGACASRPGLCYEAWISRRLDCDYINLGFAGNCKGEDAIVDYMSTLDISCFVCDYDHNAPSADHLQNTHGNVYKKMREKQPQIPIVLISKPDIKLDSDEDIRRRAIVMQTYLKGVKNGDKNLYFIDGYSLFSGADREDCTVDGCHPNDLGFYKMADIIGKTLETAMR